MRILLHGQLRYMKDHGFNVASISANSNLSTEPPYDWPHYTAPLTRRISPWQDVLAIWRLIILMRQLRPDIVHTHTPKAGLIGMLAGRLTGVPIRIHTLGGLPLVTARGGTRMLLWLAEKVTGYAAHHIWPNGPSLLSDARRLRLFPERKLDIVAHGSSNGVDLEQFSPAAVSEFQIGAVRKAISYSSDATYLLFVGRAVQDKGIPELVRMFLPLLANRPEVRLLLVGPIEEERVEEILPSETRAIIENTPEIVHIPWSDEVPAIMMIADMLIFPSHREGFPNVLLQAGAMELPIVCSSIPGNIDIVDNGRTGYTFPVGNALALLDTLEYALDHPEKSRKMASALRQEVAGKFDRKMIHAELLKRYRGLLQNAGIMNERE
ncbi:glycosyltransferase family 4 protein [Neolewinella litorea]|uniref:Glycosyltransferase family 1 protein n=1 Tax=Neolewinella litorea TaxID=2562452 RepID=A0A4S4N630_9BACT|nr:glycosyltransferase family 4 protein [Neolewinella litorea]THH34559.1 glycosyltransferase family 1 protein [Neolewinella litorea]